MIMPEKLDGAVPVSPNGKDDAGIVAELLKWVVGESHVPLMSRQRAHRCDAVSRIPRCLFALRPIEALQLGSG